MANFSFVADSKFNPLSREDVLTPLLMYKQAYDETEAAYDKLSKDSNVFSYLSKVAEENADSEAAKIYKGYADELNTQAQSLAQNGLSMANKRALLNLKRRYDSEIGVLERAQKSLEQERELRRNNKDNSMLYGVDNLDIDQFLYDKTPNLYKVSGNELYQKGAIIGKNFSSRMNETTEGTGRILGGYFRDYITRKGITPQDLNQFSNEILDDFTREVSVLPELQQAAKSVLTSYGADKNLTGDNLRKAQHQVIRGIVDNAIYEEEHKPVRDPGVMSAAEYAASKRADDNAALAKEKWETERDSRYRKNPDTGKWELNPEYKKYRDKTPEEKAAEQQFKKDEKEKESLGAAILKLKPEDLKNEKGFSVIVGDTRHNYKYLGAITEHKSNNHKWQHGKFGDDVEGLPLGYTSSNLVDWWGDYSTKDAKKSRVLSKEEVLNSANNPEFLSQIEELLAENKKYTNATIEGLLKENPSMTREAVTNQLHKLGFTYASDFQLVEVPNSGSSRKGYILAVKE